MTDSLDILIAKKFIARRDVKAVQFSNGAYSPDRELKTPNQYGPLGWKMEHIQQHLAMKNTYGHYLLDSDSNCKLFCFDIDLAKTGFWSPVELHDVNEELPTYECPDLRAEWLNRASPARPWIKMQLGMLARKFVSAIQKELMIPCAAAYSGGKGIHVYGFTGLMPAAQVRAAATLVIESMDDWELSRGQHIYKHKLSHPVMGYPNFTVEVYPKQDSLDGKDLGNLLRLPLGRNQKSTDPTFFLDLLSPIGVMAPHPDPIDLLENGNPYA